MNNVKRVFVTGASGFIGAVLKTTLADRSMQVFGAGRDGAMQEVTCDIRSQSSVSQAVRDIDPDIVIHCAGISSVTKGQPLDYYDVNVLGTENLINAVAANGRRSRFIFLSTAGVYGNQPFEVLSESLRPEPIHHYGISKLAAERIVHLFDSVLDVTIIRPFNIIGPGQDSSFIVPKLIKSFVRRDETIRLGNIHVNRDFLDVWTAAEIIADIIDRPASFGQVLNLCTGHGTSLMKLITILQDLTGHVLRVEQATEFTRKNEVWRLIGCPKKLRAVLGRQSDETYSIADVLRTMLEHQSVELTSTT